MLRYDSDKNPYSITSDIIGESWNHLCMTYSNDYVLSFYLNGKKIDSVQMDCEILQLSSDNIFVGISNDIKTNKDVFYGLVSSIEIYDIEH